MQADFRLQDPTEPPRSSLVDILTDLITGPDIAVVRGFFGFATGQGLNVLLSDDSVRRFFMRGNAELIVGLDSITDPPALTKLQEIERRNPNFRPRVVVNTSGALVHPKFIDVRRHSGHGALVVGSNNLTKGGLSGNVEAYVVIRYDPGSEPDLADWDAFLDRWRDSIRPIDAEAFSRAARNVRRTQGFRRIAARAGPVSEEEISEVAQAIPPPEARREDPRTREDVLVAQIPGAGARWSQVHLTGEIVKRFFQAQPGSRRTILLRELNSPTVEERHIVYSRISNRNVKVEIGAARGRKYPLSSRPILLCRKEGARGRFAYVLLMPGDVGHQEMLALTRAKYRGPANQLPRVIVRRTDVLRSWPTCPL